MGEGGESVVSEDDTVTHYSRKNARTESRYLSAGVVEPRTHRRHDCEHSKLSRILRWFAQRAQPAGVPG
jgi:hypothetical protein